MAAESSEKETKSRFKKARETARAEGNAKVEFKPKDDADLYTEVRVIPTADVQIVKGFNIQDKRHTDEEIAKLAEDIRLNGLLHPIVVRAVAGKRKEPDATGNVFGETYYLIAGEGRLRAIQKLGVPTIQANVKRVGALEALILNTTENVDRKDVHVWALGERLKLLHETHDLSPQRLGQMFALSPSYVRNLIRMVRDTSPDVAADIRAKMADESMHGLLPKYAWLLSACKKPVEEQNELYKVEFGEADSETESKPPTGAEGGERQYAVRMRSKNKIADMRGRVLRKLSESQKAAGMRIVVNPGRIRDPELAALFEGKKAVMTERDRMVAKLAVQWAENAQLDDPFVLENPNKVEETKDEEE